MPQPTKDDRFIQLARERFKQAEDAEQNQRQRELDDLRFYAGDQWSSDQKKAREGNPANAINGLPPVPARPTFVINKVREPVRQVLNQGEQAEYNVELVSADDFGDLAPENKDREREIELREGLLRRIQRAPESQDAREWAGSRAAIAGRGFYVVMTRFLPGQTWDQEVYLHRIYNQASVLGDPAREQPDGSDAEWWFIGVDMPIDQYEAEFGKKNRRGEEENRVVQASGDDGQWRALGDEAPNWFTADGKTKSARVVDYWHTERKARVLCLMPDGTVGWQDELVDDAPKPIDTRRVVEKTIKWCKIDGIQKLDETDWEGPDMPVIEVLGEELHPYDSEKRSEGMVRPARDSNQGFNAMASKLVETIGLTPIPPLMVAEGTWEAYQNWYQLANTRALPALPYKPTGLDGQPAPPPFRTPVDTPIAPMATALQMFDEAIKSTTGVPDSQLGHQDPTVKSGKMAQVLLAQSQHGTSHFLNNRRRSMRYEGQVINNLLYPIYGKRPGRLASIVTGTGESQTVLIAPPPTAGTPAVAPSGPSQSVPNGGASGQPPSYVLTPDATFNVAVKVTRAFDTRRDEVASLLTDMISADPKQLQIIGDIWAKNLDVPNHNEIADRYRLTLLPPIQQHLEQKAQGGPEIPPQLMAQLQQQKQQLDDAHQLLQKAASEIQTKQAELDNKLQVAKIGADKDIRLQAMRDATAIAVAHIGAAAKGVSLDAHAAEEAQALGHEAEQAAHDRAHEVGMAAMEHAHALEQGQAGADQQALAAEQGQQHALEQGQQAADLAPEPAGAEE